MAWWREEEEEKRDRSNGWAGPPQCISTIFYGTPEHRVQYMYGTNRNGCNSGLIYDNCFQRAHTHTMGLPSSSSFFTWLCICVPRTDSSQTSKFPLFSLSTIPLLVVLLLLLQTKQNGYPLKVYYSTLSLLAPSKGIRMHLYRKVRKQL